MAWSSDELKAEYEQKAPLYAALCRELKTQLGELLRDARIRLAFPIEDRVKPWDSVLEKCQRNGLEPSGVGEVKDIAGLRLIVLFRRDAGRVRQIIRDNFDVLLEEDTADRLAEDQFGYGAVHLEVKPKEAWLQLPTLRRLEGLGAEIQLRTASQHIWAAASHVLQYKKESHVPGPIRRSINRAAALLETVDLEFERVLAQREEYAETVAVPEVGAVLDTDLLRSVLDESLPPENKDASEPYADLLDELTQFHIATVADLEKLSEKHLAAARKADTLLARRMVAEAKSPKHAARAAHGLFLTHVGLVRQLLTEEFGEDALLQVQKGLRRGAVVQ